MTLTLALHLRAEAGPFVDGVKQAERSLDGVSRGAAVAGSNVVQLAQHLDRTGVVATATGARMAQAFNANRLGIQNITYQLQDVITQLQFGVPLLRTLAIQGPQMAIGFGPVPAIIATIAGAILGAVSAMGSFGSETDVAREAVDQLAEAAENQAFKLLETADSADELVDRYRDMSAALRDLVPLMLKRDLIDLRSQMQAAESDAKNLVDQMVGESNLEIYRRGESFGEVRERNPEEQRRAELMADFGELTDAFRSGEMQIGAFVQRLYQLGTEAEADGPIQEYASKLVDLGAAAVQAKDEIARLQAELAAIEGNATPDQRALLERPDKPARARAAAREKEDKGPNFGFQPPADREWALQNEALAAHLAMQEKLERVVTATAALGRQRALVEKETAAFGTENASEMLALESARLELTAQGIDLQSEQARAYLDEVAALAEVKAGLAEVERESRRVTAAADSIGNAFATGFERAILEAQTLGEAVTALGEDISRVLMRQLVTQPLANAISGGITSLFAPSPAAGAGAGASTGGSGFSFDFSGLIPHAKGGVVDGPTVFPFARGIGLMGEAGPEAILPLTRLAGGDLGVRAELGGGERGGVAAPIIELKVVNQGQPLEVGSSRQSQGPDGRRLIEVMVRSAVGEGIAKGQFDRPLSSRFGLKPVPR